MPAFRKKPVLLIEAVRFIDEPTEIAGEEPEWYRAARTTDRGEPGAINYVDGALVISTLKGEMRANPGDWIIRGVKGELYSCEPDIFDATYQPV